MRLEEPAGNSHVREAWSAHQQMNSSAEGAAQLSAGPSGLDIPTGSSPPPLRAGLLHGGPSDLGITGYDSHTKG
jgi:hypothetical protein